MKLCQNPWHRGFGTLERDRALEWGTQGNLQNLQIPCQMQNSAQVQDGAPNSPKLGNPKVGENPCQSDFSTHSWGGVLKSHQHGGMKKCNFLAYVGIVPKGYKGCQIRWFMEIPKFHAHGHLAPKVLEGR